MKTSQEIAEEMIKEFTKNQYVLPDVEFRVQERLRHLFPLAQLVEVSRAAMISPCRHNSSEDGNNCITCVALEALKQTGKAEWL